MCTMTDNWQPIKTAFKDCTEVLVFQPPLHYQGGCDYPLYITIAYYDEYKEQYFSEACNAFLVPTHWQPLPEPPKDVKPLISRLDRPTNTGFMFDVSSG